MSGTIQRYYLLLGDEETGPFSKVEIHAMFIRGEITGATLYAEPGMAKWLPVHTLLFPLPDETKITPTSISAWFNHELSGMTAPKARAVGCLGITIAGMGFLIMLAMCGPPPPPREAVTQSAWDGSVRQAEQWLKSNLKDPGSLEVIEWSPIENLGSGYAVRCKYRAKNSFGAYSLENKIFFFDTDGSVLGVKEFIR